MTAKTWKQELSNHVEKHPINIIRFDDSSWWRLKNSRKGLSEFTFARSYDDIEKISKNSVCILSGNYEGEAELYVGLIYSKSAITTLEARLKAVSVSKLSVSNEADLQNLLIQKPYSTLLRTRLSAANNVIPLSPKLSSHLLTHLLKEKGDLTALQRIHAVMRRPKRFESNSAIQLDAVQTALKAFGLGHDDAAVGFEIYDGKQTALANVKVLEDSVIEHDARTLPQYELIESHVTGKAVFKKFGQTLEIYTANKRDLEKALGVDLIYVNVSKQNVVMLQYKILEKATDKLGNTDWIYRPDTQLSKELSRMQNFAVKHTPPADEFRFNEQVFYMKFVKKYGAIHNGGIILPLDHFEQVKGNSSSVGPRGGVRVSYDALDGRYLRSGPFTNLITSGYIGSYSKTTDDLTVLIEAILQDGKSVVAAIQTDT